MSHLFKQGNINDAKAIAQIHEKAFKDFFLTKLGINFLNTYYKSCLQDPLTVAICVSDLNGNIMGFASGCLKSKGYHKKIFINNFFSFSFSLLKSLLLDPKILFRLFKNLDKNKMVDDKGEYAELLSIGINPDIKGTGIGKELLLHFENEIKTRGGGEIALTTDSTNNESVINFYHKAGYELFYEFTTYPNRPMLKLIKTIN